VRRTSRDPAPALLDGTAHSTPSGPSQSPTLFVIQPGPEFGQLFDSVEHTAFHLEPRDQYKPAK
jgi:hypothetical protein